MPIRLLLEVMSLLVAMVETLCPSLAIHELGMRGHAATKRGRRARRA